MRRLLLLIHGVGDAPDRAVQEGLEELVRARCAEADTLGLEWYDWNEAIEEMVEGPSAIDDLGTAMRRTARLGLERDLGSRRSRIRHALWALYLPLLSVFVVAVVWAAAASMLGLLPKESIPSLRVGLNWVELLFPPLPNRMVAASAPVALELLRISAAALGLGYPALQLLASFLAGPRPLRMTFRRLALELFWPLVGLLSVVMVVVAGGLLLALATAVAEAFFGAPSYVVHGVEGRHGPGRDWVLVFVLFVGACLVAAAAVHLERWTRPLRKVLSDSFRYLGDAAFRGGIHAHLRERLSVLPSAEEVVVAAHSLGSVIAVDSLLSEPGAWARYPRVRLVTGGSPLDRIFHRWFPTTYGTASQLAGDLAAAHPTLDWVNVYRPFDYIGARLGERFGGGIVNRRLPQGRRLHIAYWTDERAVEAVIDEFESAFGRAPGPAPAGGAGEAPLDRLAAAKAAGSATGPAWLAWVMVLLIQALFLSALVGVLATHFVFGPRQEAVQFDRWTALIEAGPVEVTGRACPAEQISTADEIYPPRRIVTLSYRAESGRSFRTDAAAWEHPQVDWQALHKAVYGTPMQSHLRWMFYLPDPSAKVEAGCLDAGVRYAASHPEVFTVTAFASSPPWDPLLGRMLLRLARALVTGVVAVVWVGLLLLVLLRPIGALGEWVGAGAVRSS